MNSPEFKDGDVEGHTLPMNPPTDTPNADAIKAADDYVVVRLPDGTLRAFPKEDIQDASEAPATAKQNLTAQADVIAPVAQFYVHLADGSVERVSEPDLPAGSGTNASQGFWQRDGNVFQVIGIYPVEDIAKGE